MTQSLYAINLILASCGFLITIISLYSGFGLPFFYYIGFTFISIAVILPVVRDFKYKLLILSLFSIMIGLIPIIKYGTILWGDPRYEYATMEIFQQQGHFFIISSALLQPFSYSGFPAIHLIAIQLSALSAIPLYTIAVYAAPFLSLLSMLLVERLILLYTKNSKISYLGALVFVVWPETIFYSSELIRQSLGFLLFLAALYFYSSGRLFNDRKYLSLSIVAFVAVVVAHHYSAFALFAVLASVAILEFLLSKRTRTNRIFRPGLSQVSVLALLLLLCMISFFWLTYAEPVMSSVFNSAISALLNRGQPVQATAITVSHASLEASTPLYMSVLSYLRLGILGLLTLFGVFFVLKKRDESAIFHISVLLILALLFIAGYLFGLTPDPTRNALFIIYPVSLFVGFSLYSLGRRFLLILLLCVIILPTMFSLWGFTYAPTYVYDPGPTGTTYQPDYCYTPAGYMSAALWLTNNTNYQQSIYVPSDPNVETTLYIYMQPSALYSIYRVDYRENQVYATGFNVIIAQLAAHNQTNSLIPNTTAGIYFIMSKTFQPTPAESAYIQTSMTKVYENSDCYIYYRAPTGHIGT